VGGEACGSGHCGVERDVIRQQDKIGLYVAAAFVVYAIVVCGAALLLSSPAPRASSRVLVGVSR